MRLLMVLFALAFLASPGPAASLRITIVPAGSVPKEVLVFLEKNLPKEFGAEILQTKGIPLPASAYVPQRRQYQAEAFLPGLATRRQKAKDLVLGVTTVDLFIPQLNFVFGLAKPRHHLAIISIARLDPQFYGQPRNLPLLQERALKEAVHELGHLLNLSHCQDSRCIMFFSNTLADTDHKGPSFCAACRRKLPK